MSGRDDDNCRKHGARVMPLTALGLFALFVFIIVALAVGFKMTGHERTLALDPDSSPNPDFVKTVTPLPENTPEPTEPIITPESTPLIFIITDIAVDGKVVCTLASRQTAELLLTNIIAHYAALCGADALNSEITNTITLITADASAQNDGSVVSYDEAFALLTGEDTPLRVRSFRIVSETETIEHGSGMAESFDFHIGTRFIKSYGIDGKSSHTFEYAYVNGVLASAEEQGSAELYPAIAEEIIIGIKPLPQDETIRGDFGIEDCPPYAYRLSDPISPGGMSTITKYYCFYDGELYPGLEFLCESGEFCYAALTGRVIAVLNRSAYGLTIDIEHANGAVTRYAGLASVNVGIGDEVETSQIIGTVGDDNLHFEFILSGRPLNPRVYLYGLLN